jgi:hypothetical protein
MELCRDPLSACYPLPLTLYYGTLLLSLPFLAHIHFPALPFIHFDQVFLQRHEVVVQLGKDHKDQ